MSLSFTPALAEILRVASTCHAAGDFAQAEQHYRKILHVDPNHPEVWSRLGEACQVQGRFADAVKAFRQAVRLQSSLVAAQVGLADALARQGARQEAVASYQQALHLQPENVETRVHLAIVLAELGRLTEAIAEFREALRLRPDFAKAHHNLGVALSQDGKLEEAEASLREALRCKPDYAEAYYNLGNTLSQLGRPQEAVESYQYALQVRSDYADALNNLGLLLNDLGRSAEAVVMLRQAVRLRPAFLTAWNNLGLALAELGRFAEAEASYLEALRQDPGFADAHTNLGSTYKESGRLEEAIACYELALRLDPDAASTHWNRSLAWLQMGDYERGWPEYEWRWQRKQARPRSFSQPLWNGAALDGRTIFLYPEQGYGDTIQFVRYGRLVKEQGARVLLECPPLLWRLFRTLPWVDQLVAEDAEPPPFDVQAPLLTLPALFGTTLATVPADVPYLFPEPALVEDWRRRLSEMVAFKIGIVWQGNPHHRWDRRRSLRLARFAPLARVEGVRLLSMQKGPATAQIAECAASCPVTDLGNDPPWDYLDTAALMKNLDLVITADTSTAHLAGALGVPVWVPLATVSDWRWLLKREDSPWYPTLRLFRQKEYGDWEPVFERMAEELQRLVHARSRLPASEDVTRRTDELRGVNARLWQIDEDLKACERNQDFGPRFVEAARALCRERERRRVLIQQINELSGIPHHESRTHAE